MTNHNDSLQDTLDNLRDTLLHFGAASEETHKALLHFQKYVHHITRRKPLIHNGKAYRK